MDVSLPRWVFLQLLEHCNLRCRMCYEWGEHGVYDRKQTLRRLDVEIIRRVIDECEPARPYYDLYGGEPLLYPQIGEVLRAIQRAGSRVQLPTNGTLLTRYSELLVETAVDRIWVSLDGPPEVNDQQRGAGVFACAVEGIERLFRLRTQRGAAHPQIGMSLVVTPLNHRHLETFFFGALDLEQIDCISIELQAYLTSKEHQTYEQVLKQEFGVDQAPIARGFLNEPAVFADIDSAVLVRQVDKIGAYCREKGLYLNTYPKVMSEDNIRKYFRGDRVSMTSIRTRCPFPWISTEVSARGDVTSCHAFYDLSLGNVYESSIVDIWRGERYVRYRNYLRRNLLPICTSCVLFHEETPSRSGVSCNRAAN
jgi:radical SAM protein with 4Fe4S-binding SPASM domain